MSFLQNSTTQLIVALSAVGFILLCCLVIAIVARRQFKKSKTKETKKKEIYRKNKRDNKTIFQERVMTTQANEPLPTQFANLITYNTHHSLDDEEDTDPFKTLTVEYIKEFCPVSHFHHSKRSNPYNLKDCSICKSKLKIGDRVRTISLCKHVFHSGCLVDWLKEQEKCPICGQCLHKEFLDMLNKSESIKFQNSGDKEKKDVKVLKAVELDINIPEEKDSSKVINDNDKSDLQLKMNKNSRMSMVFGTKKRGVSPNRPYYSKAAKNGKDLPNKVRIQEESTVVIKSVKGL